MSRSPRGRALLLAVAAVSCASPGAGHEAAEGVVESRQPDVLPRLIRCGSYEEPSRAFWADTELVTVPVLIGADGRVAEVGMGQLVTSPADLSRRTPDSLRHEAEALARECEFDPAYLRGPTRHAVSFRFPR